MAEVSVIIPTYNGAGFIAQTVESVLAQTLPDLELIVVNDGSTDATEQVLKQFCDKLRVVSGKRKGIPAARNVGLRASGGRYVCFLDHDDLWMPQKLSRQLELFEKDVEIGFSFTDYETFGDPAPYQKGFEENGGKVRELPREEIGPRAFKILSESLFVDMVNGALPCWTSTIMMRRSVFEFVGPFDEALLINDDTQMWLRFAKQCRFAYVDEPLAKQRVRNSSTSLAMAMERKHTDSILMFERLREWVELTPAESRAVQSRMAGLCMGLGYLEFTEGRLRSAGAQFRKSLRLRFSTWTLAYYLLTFLPASGIRRMRALKHRISM
jgi:glycosyltransferase involved in cell wall biosynthesis